jgi:hypothetical protein
MNRLLEIGVQPAGHWLLEGNQFTFELARHSAQKNILYAFVCDGEVKYVGKTTRTLATRMAGYKRPGKTQTTNINNHRRIRRRLARSRSRCMRPSFRSGFFNVGVSSQGYLGADGETVELFLGGESRPVLGTINRRANMSSRTPTKA